MQDFEGKVAVVTGAASGMGRAFAERFAQAGMKVVLADVEQPALDAAVRELRLKEHDVLGVVTDVSQADAVEALAKQTVDAYGKVHIVCNNAGVGGGRGAIWEASMKDWQWTMGVNFWGVVHGIRTFVPLMLAQGEEGHVVNTASLYGIVSAAGIYPVTKHAVVAMSESLSIQLRMAGSKIGVSVLCPRLVMTQLPNSARNRPEELQNDPAFALPTEDLAPFQRYRQRFRAAAEHGIDPAEVADQVFDAIRDDVFYIVTRHSPGSEVLPTVEERFEALMTGRKPKIPLNALEPD